MAMENKIVYITALVFTLLTASCQAASSPAKQIVDTGQQPLVQETKFNSSYIKLTNEELQAYGFSFGDSCNVYFSNGKSILDVPYYDGYYTRSDYPLICGYQGYPYVQITINNGSDFWDKYALSENYTVEISLNEKGKYLAEQEAFSMHYSNERDDFPSDAAFANFRMIGTTNIKSGVLYRGASPFNDTYNRAPYVDTFLEENQVKFILDLSDSELDLESYVAEYDFVADSYPMQQEKVLLSMGSNFRTSGDVEIDDDTLFGLGLTTLTYKEKLVEGLNQMILSPGPYYVHCVEGKDRTGFVSMILEAICGATYQEMKDDYMVTYINYFKLAKDSEKYNAVAYLRFDEFMEYLSGQEKNLDTISYADYAKDYLKAGGMSEENIQLLVDRLTK